MFIFMRKKNALGGYFTVNNAENFKEKNDWPEKGIE